MSPSVLAKRHPFINTRRAAGSGELDIGDYPANWPHAAAAAAAGVMSDVIN